MMARLPVPIIPQLQPAKACHCERSEAIFSLNGTQIASGTGILPVSPNRQARSLSHHALAAMTENRQFLRATEWLAGLTGALKTSVLTLLILLITAASWAANEIHFVMWKPDHPEVWNKLISKFERETGIKVQVGIGPNSSTAAHALISQRLKNADPDLDVFMMDVIWPSEFVSANWIQALGSYFPTRDRADFFPAAISACTIRGKIYGVPFETSGGILFCRKDLLDKYGFQPPETWDQLVQEAGHIVSRERSHDPALRGYCGQFKQYEGLVCNMQEFLTEQSR